MPLDFLIIQRALRPSISFRMLKIKSLKIIHYPKSGTKIVRVRNCLKRRETMTTTTIVSMNFIWVYRRLRLQLQKEARKVLNFSACVYWSVRSSGPDVVRQFVQMHPHARNMNHLAKWKCVSCRAIFGINRSHIAFYSTRTQLKLLHSLERNNQEPSPTPLLEFHEMQWLS